jgi:predicted RNA-binding Zn-ribbon protein involved in translation (DUF1610 family)
MNDIDRSTALWPPPEGFVPVPSQVDGIEIYAPAPKEEAEETRTFKCRYCGGSIAYSASEQQLTCPYCGRTQELIAEEVGQAAAEFEFTLETMARARYGWGEERRELVCESCGAAVAVAPDVLTSTCVFCGSNRVHARDITGEHLRPTALIPFVVDREHLQAQVAEWLGRGWMHPPELRDVRALRELTGVYLPFWTFDAHIGADWKAEVGTPRTELERGMEDAHRHRLAVEIRASAPADQRPPGSRHGPRQPGHPGQGDPLRPERAGGVRTRLPGRLAG